MIARIGNLVFETQWDGRLRCLVFRDEVAAREWLKGSGRVVVSRKHLVENYPRSIARVEKLGLMH